MAVVASVMVDWISLTAYQKNGSLTEMHKTIIINISEPIEDRCWALSVGIINIF